MTTPIDLDHLEASLRIGYGGDKLYYCTPAERKALITLPALIAELRTARNYIVLLEQAAGHVIQEQRSAVYAVYSRPECPFQYCDSPSDCEGRCHHRPQEPSQ